eukprot:9472181-Pyramimonas_sp.AAC.1
MDYPIVATHSWRTTVRFPSCLLCPGHGGLRGVRHHYCTCHRVGQTDPRCKSRGGLHLSREPGCPAVCARQSEGRC